MKNYIKEGRKLEVTAPYDVASGGGCLVGSIFGVAELTAATGAKLMLDTQGVYTLPKTSALAIAIGDLLYWDDTNKVVNKTSAGQKLVGVALSVAGNPSATVQVRLNGCFTT